MTALYIFISFIASALTSMLLMPWILSLCKRNGYFDRPNDRKVHKNNTPRLGGVVFVGTANGDGLIALRYGVAGDLVLLGGLVDRVLIAAFFFDDGVAKVGVEVRLLPNRTGIHLADE